ncbi:MAG: hypothetical protein WA828_15575, partial [Coleofasciculaceae cyanobacterium]
FEGDLIVTQRAPQLYAQSLRGGSKPKEDHVVAPSKVTDSGMPWWLVIPASGGVLAALTGAFWLGRRTNQRLIPVSTKLADLSDNSPNNAPGSYPVSSNAASEDAPSWSDNHQVTNQESEVEIHK